LYVIESREFLWEGPCTKTLHYDSRPLSSVIVSLGQMTFKMASIPFSRPFHSLFIIFVKT
jgi:hypothetical protein